MNKEGLYGTFHTRSTCVAFGHYSGQLFASGTANRRIHIYILKETKPCATLLEERSLKKVTDFSIDTLTFESGEENIISGTSNGLIQLWSLQKQRVIKHFKGHRSSISSLSFHPFSDYFASGSNDNNVIVYDIRRKNSLQTYKGHNNTVTNLSFTPDGKWLISADNVGVSKLWDLTAGKILHSFEGHRGAVSQVRFHPSEFVLAVSSMDGLVKIWDLESFKCTHTFRRGATFPPFNDFMFDSEGVGLLCCSEQGFHSMRYDPKMVIDDEVNVGWGCVEDMMLCGNEMSQVFALSSDLTKVHCWLIDCQRMKFWEHVVRKREDEELDAAADDKEGERFMAAAKNNNNNNNDKSMVDRVDDEIDHPPASYEGPDVLKSNLSILADLSMEGDELFEGGELPSETFFAEFREKVRALTDYDDDDDDNNNNTDEKKVEEIEKNKKKEEMEVREEEEEVPTDEDLPSLESKKTPEVETKSEEKEKEEKEEEKKEEEEEEISESTTRKKKKKKMKKKMTKMTKVSSIDFVSVVVAKEEILDNPKFTTSPAKPKIYEPKKEKEESKQENQKPEEEEEEVEGEDDDDYELVSVKRVKENTQPSNPQSTNRKKKSPPRMIQEPKKSQQQQQPHHYHVRTKMSRFPFGKKPIPEGRDRKKPIGLHPSDFLPISRNRGMKNSNRQMMKKKNDESSMSEEDIISSVTKSHFITMSHLNVRYGRINLFREKFLEVNSNTSFGHPERDLKKDRIEAIQRLRDIKDYHALSVIFDFFLADGRQDITLSLFLELLPLFQKVLDGRPFKKMVKVVSCKICKLLKLLVQSFQDLIMSNCRIQVDEYSRLEPSKEERIRRCNNIRDFLVGPIQQSLRKIYREEKKLSVPCRREFEELCEVLNILR